MYKISWSFQYLTSLVSKEDTVSAPFTLSGREFQASTTLLLKECFMTSSLALCLNSFFLFLLVTLIVTLM